MMSEPAPKIRKASGNDYAEHEATYVQFTRFGIAGTFICATVLMSLLLIGVIGGGAFWIGLFGLVFGIATVLSVWVAEVSWFVALIPLLMMIILSLPFL